MDSLRKNDDTSQEPRLTDEGLDMIKHFEGWRATVYRDAAGYPTIGYGHLLKEGESFPDGITKEEGTSLLRQDTEIAQRAVREAVTVPLTDRQFSALVSFAYNLGGGALRSSTLLRLLNAGDYDGAATQFDRWVYAGGRRLAGLVRRRVAERAMFEGLDWRTVANV